MGLQIHQAVMALDDGALDPSSSQSAASQQLCSSGAASASDRRASSEVGPSGRTLTHSMVTPGKGKQSNVEKKTPKSAKRKAAEALLARKYATSTGVEPDLGPGPQSSVPQNDHTPSRSSKRARRGSQPESVSVPPCPPDCCHSASETVAGWCNFDVRLPATMEDLHRLIAMDVAAPQSMMARPGTSTEAPAMQAGAARATQRGAAGSNAADSGVCMRLGEHMEVIVVEKAAQLEGAIARLRASMRDQVVAIDLEWRPDYSGGHSSRVALIQLATSGCCLLIRTCRMRHPKEAGLHTALRAFLGDPAVTLVGYSWDRGDERKMRASFGVGRSDFGAFLDLQAVSEALGYHNYGLAGLTKRVLGLRLPKDKQVTMSNWETPRLSLEQVCYAALDAVVTGQVFRALRLWHTAARAAAPPCSACRVGLGGELPLPEMKCQECQREFGSVSSLMRHCQDMGHHDTLRKCEQCGRCCPPRQTAA